MSKINDNKSNPLTRFVSKVKQLLLTENPLNPSYYRGDSTEEINQASLTPSSQQLTTTLERMAVIGLFDTIKVIAEAGKTLAATGVHQGTRIPTALTRVYLNGILNSCALIEECCERDEKRVAQPETKPKGTQESRDHHNKEVTTTTKKDSDDDDDDEGEGEGVTSPPHHLNRESSQEHTDGDEEEDIDEDGDGEDDNDNNNSDGNVKRTSKLSEKEFDSILKQFSLSANKKNNKGQA